MVSQHSQWMLFQFLYHYCNSYWPPPDKKTCSILCWLSTDWLLLPLNSSICVCKVVATILFSVVQAMSCVTGVRFFVEASGGLSLQTVFLLWEGGITRNAPRGFNSVSKVMSHVKLERVSHFIAMWTRAAKWHVVSGARIILYCQRRSLLWWEYCSCLRRQSPRQYFFIGRRPDLLLVVWGVSKMRYSRGCLRIFLRYCRQTHMNIRLSVSFRWDIGTWNKCTIIWKRRGRRMICPDGYT